MKLLPRYLIATILFILLAPILVQIVLAIIGPFIPHPTWLESSILALLYVATIVWLHRRGKELHPPPPYIVFGLVYWTVVGWWAIGIAIFAAHMQGGDRTMFKTLAVYFALAALLHWYLHRRLRKRAERRARAGEGPEIAAPR